MEAVGARTGPTAPRKETVPDRLLAVEVGAEGCLGTEIERGIVIERGRVVGSMAFGL